MGRIVDLKGRLFLPDTPSSTASVWSDKHLKRSELFNYQLKQLFHEDLSMQRFMRFIAGGSILDLSTSFTSLIRERELYKESAVQ